MGIYIKFTHKQQTGAGGTSPRGIIIESEKDAFGNWVLLIRKSRGKLTLQEINDLLLYEDGGKYNGLYAIVLNASESACGGSGWDDGSEPKGDVAELYELYAGNDCPVCRKLLPEKDFCPHCGEKLK